METLFTIILPVLAVISAIYLIYTYTKLPIQRWKLRKMFKSHIFVATTDIKDIIVYYGTEDSATGMVLPTYNTVKTVACVDEKYKRNLAKHWTLQSFDHNYEAEEGKYLFLDTYQASSGKFVEHEIFAMSDVLNAAVTEELQYIFLESFGGALKYFKKMKVRQNVRKGNLYQVTTLSEDCKSEIQFEVKISLENNDIQISKVSEDGYVRFDDSNGYIKAHGAWREERPFEMLLNELIEQRFTKIYNIVDKKFKNLLTKT